MLKLKSITILSIAFFALSFNISKAECSLNFNNLSINNQTNADKADIVRLQSILYINELYDGPITGYYGNLTSKAINNLKKQYNLKQDGIVDESMVDIICNDYTLCPFQSNLQKEDEYPAREIKALQSFLRLLPNIYPERLVTGYFGSKTENAVKRLQKQLGISQTGKMDSTARRDFCDFFDSFDSIGSTTSSNTTAIFQTLCLAFPKQVKTGENVLFISQILGGTSPYKYVWDNKSTNNDKTFKTMFSKSGTHSIELKVIDSKGNVSSTKCSVSVTGESIGSDEWNSFVFDSDDSNTLKNPTINKTTTTTSSISLDKDEKSKGDSSNTSVDYMSNDCVFDCRINPKTGYMETVFYYKPTGSSISNCRPPSTYCKYEWFGDEDGSVFTTTSDKHLMLCGEEQNLIKDTPGKVRISCPPDKFSSKYKNIPYVREAICKAPSESTRSASGSSSSKAPNTCKGSCICDNWGGYYYNFLQSSGFYTPKYSSNYDMMGRTCFHTEAASERHCLTGINDRWKSCYNSGWVENILSEAKVYSSSNILISYTGCVAPRPTNRQEYSVSKWDRYKTDMFVAELYRSVDVQGKDQIEDPENPSIKYAEEGTRIVTSRLQRLGQIVTPKRILWELQNWWDNLKYIPYKYIECNEEWCYVCNPTKTMATDKCILMNKAEYTKPENKSFQRYDGVTGCYTEESPCYRGSYFKCLTKYGQCVLTNESTTPSGSSDKTYQNLWSCIRSCKVGESKEEKLGDNFFSGKSFGYRIDGDSCVPTTRTGWGVYPSLYVCFIALYDNSDLFWQDTTKYFKP